MLQPTFDLNAPPALSASSVQSPQGHGLRNNHRVFGEGTQGFPTPHPVMGMIPTNLASDFHFTETENSGMMHSSHGPKMEFPKFDGSNPRLWRNQCVLFFEVYGTPPAMKTRFAILNFKGAAATWLQKVERHGRITDWTQLCELVFQKYDKDQYQQSLRQLDLWKQTGSVSKYHCQFEKLAHGILLYNPAYDDVYFVTRFLTGLKEEIRGPIALHRPKDVDTASALALLQEEELNACKHKPFGRVFTKGNDKWVTDRASGSSGDKVQAKTQKSDTEEKLSALKQYRRKNGLCFKCGEKWSTTHQCPEQIPLHVLEELWDALDMPSAEEVIEVESETMSADDSVCSLQLPDGQAVKRKQTLKLLARIGKHQVLVLVDSGSLGTFVSNKLVQMLDLQSEPCQSATFRAADGGHLQCSQKISQLQWTVQGHQFKSDARVLELRCYDMILGEDWLEAVSPVWVDYTTKAMRIIVNGKRISLQGIKDIATAFQQIGAKKLVDLIQHGGVMCCLQMTTNTSDSRLPDDCQSVMSIQSQKLTEPPEAVQQLLCQYDKLFNMPDSLPPSRADDHKIRLIPEAQPVRIRPYHYSPIQKDEIEAQVSKMLQQGIIRPSNSNFASPVLLVRKKDNTWRFCIDYRHLNAITMKHKHPMPVVDELLDEISGAQWFTKLDFSSGYHQIRMAVGDEFKTAFRTHQGLYEFLVMPFGLTNAPATFQSLMNVIFASLLRKGVLVFMDDILIYSRTLEEHVKLLQQVFEILE